MEMLLEIFQIHGVLVGWLLKVTDLLVRVTRETKEINKTLLYIYDNGTIERRIVIE